MKRWLTRLLPTRTTHLVLAREREGDDMLLPTGATLSPVHASQGPAFDMLDAFCAANGFGEGWVAAMIQCGANAVVASREGVPMAMAWTISLPFHVEEIRAIFDVGEGAYLFGDYVAPAYRGQRLQRILVEYRMTKLKSPTAFTLIHPENTASFKSYINASFKRIGEIENRKWLGKETLRAHSTTPQYTVVAENQTIQVRAMA